jgi:acetyl esterase
MAEIAGFTTEDVTFAPGLMARLYRPHGAGPHPALIDVHGGAWTQGDRTMNAVIAEALAHAGILVASLDFRMPPDAAFPAAQQDVALGAAWLRREATNLGSRADLVGGLGTSSGGQLLLTHALTAAPAGRLAFAIGAWPVACPLTRWQMAREKALENLIRAHQAFWPDEAAMEQASPLQILQRGEAGDLPPLLVLQGSADANLPDGLASRFVDAWSRAGGEASLEMFPGAPHSFVAADPAAPAAKRALAAMVAFVQRSTRHSV